LADGGEHAGRQPHRLAGEPARRSKAAKTNNQYIDFAHTFAHWCVVQKYLAFNPFKDVEKARNTTRRRVFRALTKEGQQRLLTRTLSTERRIIYLIALLSGLRRDEIARLCWAHMDLDKPCWLLAAANTKNRRDTALEMNAELAAALRAWKSQDAAPLDRIVSHVPKWKTFKADLKRAEIPYYDDQGRQASFHALRKTFGTELALAGVSLVKAMPLMRHSDPKLTARIYCDAGVLDLDGAVNSLRSLGVAVLTMDDLPEEAA
jgi:integrase/recombinase XerC